MSCRGVRECLNGAAITNAGGLEDTPTVGQVGQVPLTHTSAQMEL